MKKKLLFLGVFLLSISGGCNDVRWIDVANNTVTRESGELEEVQSVSRGFINCSYIRGDHFDQNMISSSALRTCNDLIYMTCRPYANGELSYDIPVNDGVIVGAKQIASIEGRNGVLKFDGMSSMNVGEGLLNSPDGAMGGFTFGTYLYIDAWVTDATLFAMKDGSVSLKMDATAGKLKFAIGSVTATAQSPGLTMGTWHYVALTYSAGVAKLYIDDDNVGVVFSGGTLPAKLPNNRASLILGDKLQGYLDDTFVNPVVSPTLGKSGVRFDVWPGNKTLAYWKYDESGMPGKDSHTWLTRLEQIRKSLGAQQQGHELRLGAAGGEWVAMVKNVNARAKFASEIKKVLITNDLHGVDLDFEWAATALDAYSATIVKLREELGASYTISVSLHPTAYKISKAAIGAIDFVTYQCYGPKNLSLFELNTFKKYAQEMISYGCPKEKLLMGVPFYGSTGVAGEQVGYSDYINKGGLTDMTQDRITYGGKEYVFNSQNTITKKTEYVCEEAIGGIMSWDLSLDLDYTDSRSLLRAVQKVFDDFTIAN